MTLLEVVTAKVRCRGVDYNVPYAIVDIDFNGQGYLDIELANFTANGIKDFILSRWNTHSSEKFIVGYWYNNITPTITTQNISTFDITDGNTNFVQTVTEGKKSEFGIGIYSNNIRHIVLSSVDGKTTSSGIDIVYPYFVGTTSGCYWLHPYSQVSDAKIYLPSSRLLQLPDVYSNYGLEIVNGIPVCNYMSNDFIGSSGQTQVIDMLLTSSLITINQTPSQYPIQYQQTNCTLSGPDEAAVGDTVTVSCTFPEGYGIANPSSSILVTNNGVAIDYTYSNGVITFTMPDPT